MWGCRVSDLGYMGVLYLVGCNFGFIYFLYLVVVFLESGFGFISCTEDNASYV